jgi:hypothetical protein
MSPPIALIVIRVNQWIFYYCPHTKVREVRTFPAASFFSGNLYPAQTPVNVRGLPSGNAAASHRLRLEFFV